MRAVLVHPGPHFSVADVHRGWVKGLRQNNVEVAEYNLDQRLNFFSEAMLDRNGELRKAFSTEQAAHLAMNELKAHCFDWWPQLVIVISGFFLNEFICKVMRARGMKVVLVHTESPYEDTKQVLKAGWVDLNVVNDPTNIDEFRKHAPTVYLPHCYDPDIHYPRPPVDGFESDFVFVGTGYESRVEFLEAVDWSGINAKLAGNWAQLSDDSPLLPLVAHDVEDCCETSDTTAFYASTKCSANLYRTEALHPDLQHGWSMGPREVELAASGTFFLRSPRGESDAVLPMLPTFSSPEDFGDTLRYWLARPQERAEAALKAREAVVDRTFDRNAAELLSLL